MDFLRGVGITSSAKSAIYPGMFCVRLRFSSTPAIRLVGCHPPPTSLRSTARRRAQRSVSYFPYIVFSVLAVFMSTLDGPRTLDVFPRMPVDHTHNRPNIQIFNAQLMVGLELSTAFSTLRFATNQPSYRPLAGQTGIVFVRPVPVLCRRFIRLRAGVLAIACQGACCMSTLAIERGSGPGLRLRTFGKGW